MASLESKSKCFAIVINEKAPNELEALEDKLNDCAIFNFYALIIHDKDITSKGNLKTKHLHLYGEKPSQIALKTLLNELCDKLNLNKEQISIDKTTNDFLYIQYLTHKNDPNKHQYDFNDIKTNNEAELLCRYSKVYKKPLTEEDIENAVFNSQTLRELTQSIGLDLTKKYQSVFNQIQKEPYQKLNRQDLIGAVQDYEQCIKELYKLIISRTGIQTKIEADKILENHSIFLTEF